MSEQNRPASHCAPAVARAWVAPAWVAPAWVAAGLALAAGAAGQTADHPQLRAGNGAGQELFAKYRALPPRQGGFKVFALAPGDAVVFARDGSFEDARAQALAECRSASTVHGPDCRVFAVGDTIVWDLPRAEAIEVIAAYRESQRAATRIERVMEVLADVLREAYSSAP